MPNKRIYEDEAYILKANIATLSEKHGTSKEDMADELGMSDRSFFNRIKYPWNFTVEELSILAGMWDVTVRELLTKPEELQKEEN